jgi:mannonate dehydratase
MYIGEQLISPTEGRLNLSAQLGSKGIVIDSRPNTAIMREDGRWDGTKIAVKRRWIESFGMPLKVMALDVGAILLDSLRAPQRAAATASELRHNISAAAEGGVDTVKFNLQMVGVTRTAIVAGRGGVRCSAFRAVDYKPEADRAFFYWGVGHIGGGQKNASDGRPSTSANRKPAVRCWHPKPAASAMSKGGTQSSISSSRSCRPPSAPA